MRRLIFTLCFFLFATPTFAALTPGTWSSVGPTSAVGSVGGIEILATTNAEAAFTDAATHRFTNTNVLCGGWDVVGFEFELPESALALTTTYVNAGDAQQFDFDVPWDGGYFYIENFDSSSIATITVAGGKLELVAASPSISYAGSSMASGVLSTSNTGFDGEGDAVFAVSGNVTSILVSYEQGEGANGVFYGFAEASANAVPEPASVVVWGSLLAVIGGVLHWRRRRTV
jgi:hypothetical protein